MSVNSFNMTEKDREACRQHHLKCIGNSKSREEDRYNRRYSDSAATPDNTRMYDALDKMHDAIAAKEISDQLYNRLLSKYASEVVGHDAVRIELDGLKATIRELDLKSRTFINTNGGG